MSMTVALYKKLDEVEPQLRGVLFAILEEIERQREETVTKSEFSELREIVGELALAQKQTQKELKELAEAQKQSEIRLSRLEVAVNRLTDTVQDLVKEHSKTRAQLNGLSTTVGFVLENEAYKSLPALLKQEFGLEVQGKLLRKYVTDKKGEQIEVNIIGEAVRNGNHFVIIGESKSQLSRNKIAEFLNKKLKRLEGVFAGELFPILITHMISQPDVADYALQQGIKRVYYSYEFSS
jgi:thioesterase domain-containing protein